MQAPSAGVLASSLEVGSSVYLMENGTAAEYLVVNQGIPGGSSLYDSSCDGTWLLRKDIYATPVWDSYNNSYGDSDIHAYLTNTFFNVFSSETQSIIKQVNIPYQKGSGPSGSVASGSNGLKTKVFLLSAKEASILDTGMPSDGNYLSYWGGNYITGDAPSRIAYYNGVAYGWWTRTPSTKTDEAVFAITNTGNASAPNCQGTNAGGTRPALILPSTAKFDKDTMILKG